MQEFLCQGLKKISVNISHEQENLLLKYLQLLTEYNEHTNLTAIREPKEIIEKHFIDSLLLQKYFQKEFKTALDIGTGAGFPGMVLAICNPEIKFTLMDSVGKKTKFLELVRKTLEIKNIDIITSRAEEYIEENNRRESFDVGLCRGVSKISTILEYMIPFLKVDAKFFIQKIIDSGEESESKNALNILRSKIIREDIFELPYCNDKRKIIIVQKESVTEKKYPRKVGMPQKNPL
ncbi:MAG: 16S rRNA (guanine(527)-N(7))-methyltransferase RsmG [Fusobacteriaceae bacterium]